jgi:hypothetical protein
MAMTVSVVFCLHSLLFAGYLAYLLHLVLFRPGDPGPVTPAGPEVSLAGWDDRIVVATAHVTLLLYLLYAEIYLYHTGLLARA